MLVCWECIDGFRIKASEQYEQEQRLQQHERKLIKLPTDEEKSNFWHWIKNFQDIFLDFLRDVFYWVHGKEEKESGPTEEGGRKVTNIFIRMMKRVFSFDRRDLFLHVTLAMLI